MGGAGGVIGTNQLGEAAPNGETIGFFTLDIIAQLLSNPALRVNYADFVMIAGVENPLVAYARKDIPPGLKVATDIMKTKDFKALSLNVQNSNTINQALSLDLLGLKYQAVPAFRGLKEVETAILQNEGQFANTSLPGWRGSIESSMGNIVMPLWQIAARAKDGSYPRSPALPDLPTFEEFYASVNDGKKPSGFLYEVLRASSDPLVAMFRTALMPPEDAQRSGDDHARRLRRTVEGPRFHPRLRQHREDHPYPRHRRGGAGDRRRARQRQARDQGVPARLQPTSW